jgi:hypothetical protein
LRYPNILKYWIRLLFAPIWWDISTYWSIEYDYCLLQCLEVSQLIEVLNMITVYFNMLIYNMLKYWIRLLFAPICWDISTYGSTEYDYCLLQYVEISQHTEVLNMITVYSNMLTDSQRIEVLNMITVYSNMLRYLNIFKY